MKNITLQTLRDWDTCASGYDKISKYVGEDEVINLDLALRVIPIPDVVWALAHDPDIHRWLGFLSDTIDLPGCEAVAQAIRDYRDGNSETVVTRAASYDAARAATYAASYATTAALTVYASANAAYAAACALSIGGKPRLVNLIRSYYQ